MGTQQLLLITVGVIVVGIMIYAGYNIGRDYMENANRDQVVTTLYDLGLMAQQHYRKERASGGGGGTFTGWSIPANFRNTESGSFNEVVHADRVDFAAEGNMTGRNGRSVVRVTARVDETGIRITVIN